MKRLFRLRGNRLIGGIVATVFAGSVCEAQQPPIDVLVDRLGAYLLDYETKVFELAAEEQYDQRIKRRSGYGGATVGRRKLKSTYFLLRLPESRAWQGLREVETVDGRTVPAPSRPIAPLLNQRTSGAYEEALSVARENAKYNIGDVFRTINVPLQALQLLHPENRQRFTFRAAGRERVRGQDTIVVGYAEQTRPTIISDGFDGDRPAHGRVWVEPVTGAVLRTELGVTGFTMVLKDALIRVDFERDARLEVLVPTEMEETYGLDIEVVQGRATYRNYRRFETSGRIVTPPG